MGWAVVGEGAPHPRDLGLSAAVEAGLQLEGGGDRLDSLFVRVFPVLGTCDSKGHFLRKTKLVQSMR